MELDIWNKGKLPQNWRIKAQIFLVALTCATLWDHFYKVGISALGAT